MGLAGVEILFVIGTRNDISYIGKNYLLFWVHCYSIVTKKIRFLFFTLLRCFCYWWLLNHSLVERPSWIDKLISSLTCMTSWPTVAGLNEAVYKVEIVGWKGKPFLIPPPPVSCNSTVLDSLVQVPCLRLSAIWCAVLNHCVYCFLY